MCDIGILCSCLSICGCNRRMLNDLFYSHFNFISFHLECFVFTKFSLCQIMSYWASLTCSSQSHSFLRIKRKLMESIVWILRNICKKLCHICMVLYLNNSGIPDKNQWFCNQLHNLHRAIVNFIWYIIAHTWN